MFTGPGHGLRLGCHGDQLGTLTYQQQGIDNIKAKYMYSAVDPDN